MFPFDEVIMCQKFHNPVTATGGGDSWQNEAPGKKILVNSLRLAVLVFVAMLQWTKTQRIGTLNHDSGLQYHSWNWRLIVLEFCLNEALHFFFIKSIPADRNWNVWALCLVCHICILCHKMILWYSLLKYSFSCRSIVGNPKNRIDCRSMRSKQMIRYGDAAVVTQNTATDLWNAGFKRYVTCFKYHQGLASLFSCCCMCRRWVSYNVYPPWVSLFPDT